MNQIYDNFAKSIQIENIFCEIIMNNPISIDSGSKDLFTNYDNELELWHYILIGFGLQKKSDKVLLKKVNGIILKKGIEQSEQNAIQYWNGTSMSINYFFSLSSYEANNAIEILTEKVIQKLDAFYQEEPFNISIKNGIVGIIICLCLAFERTGNMQILSRINKIVDFITILKMDVYTNSEFLNFFPDKYNPNTNEIIMTNNLSWDTGNLALALLFFRLGKCLNKSYTDWALRILSFSLIQKKELLDNTGISISSGYTGNVMLYHYFGSIYRNPKYLQAAKYWLKEANRLVPKIENPQNSSIMDGYLGLNLVNVSIKKNNTDWFNLLLLH
jgi:lantibiotic biosynthesis protein